MGLWKCGKHASLGTGVETGYVGEWEVGAECLGEIERWDGVEDRARVGETC